MIAIRLIHACLASGALCTLLAFAGCDGSNRGYPDDTRDTQVRADAIRNDSARRTEAADAEYKRRDQELAFRSTQVADAAKTDRGQIDLDRDRAVQPLEADRREAVEAARREDLRIDEETTRKTATVDAPEAQRLRADAASRKADADKAATDKTSSIDARIAKADAQAAEKKRAIDEREAKDQAEIRRQRDEAGREAREKQLAIEAETSRQLDALAKDSKQRNGERTKAENDALERDRGIAKDVRSQLDEKRARTGAVAVDSRDGVVTLSGSVPDETTRHEVVADTAKVDGVKSVDDRLSIR